MRILLCIVSALIFAETLDAVKVNSASLNTQSCVDNDIFYELAQSDCEVKDYKQLAKLADKALKSDIDMEKLKNKAQ